MFENNTILYIVLSLLLIVVIYKIYCLCNNKEGVTDDMIPEKTTPSSDFNLSDAIKKLSEKQEKILATLSFN